MNCSGGANRCREAAAQVEQRDGLTKRKHDQPWSTPGPVDASGGLEDFGHAGVDIGGAVENRTDCALGRALLYAAAVIIR